MTTTQLPDEGYVQLAQRHISINRFPRHLLSEQNDRLPGSGFVASISHYSLIRLRHLRAQLQLVLLV